MHVTRIRAVLVAVIAVVLAMLTVGASASVAATKPYSLVICALGTSETCAPSPTSGANQPAGVPAGATGVSMTATFTNENKVGTGLQLGSANLTPPAGLTVAGASISGCTTCATVVGNVVQIRGLSLSPGASVTVGMAVTTPAAGCTVASPCTWAVETKQANNFSGPPGNDLSLDSTTSTLNTVLAHLQFGSQPHSVALGQVITDLDYTPPPAGGPVTVVVADANGTPVTSYDGVVSLVLDNPSNPFTNPFPATLGGTTSPNASAGLATFSDLTVSDPGNGFKLTASSTDLPPSARSDPFNVQQSAALCSKDKSCSAEATSPNAGATDGGIDVTVTSPSGDASELTQSIDFGSWSASTRIGECGAASAHFAYQAFTTPRPLASTIITTDLELTKSNLTSAVSAQEICLTQTSPFIAKNVSTKKPSLMPAQPVLTLPDGTQGTPANPAGFAGLEPDCGTKSNQVPPGTGPCVTSRSGVLNSSGVGGTLTITDSSPSDRWIN